MRSLSDSEQNSNSIKLLALDVDGTLTDGKIYMGNDGEAMKAFCVKDGFAIGEMLPKHDITPIIITGRQSKIVANRARELGIELVFQGVRDKPALLGKIAAEQGLSFAEIAYVGDDLRDYAAMKLCGFKACPADAAAEIRELCDYVSPFNGGNGAVRDICEIILKRIGKYNVFLGLFGVS